MMRVPAAVRALLTNAIDYAGLYPPSALPLEIVEERYRGFRASPENWMLNRLVLPLARLPEAKLAPDWRVTLLADTDPGVLPRQVESIESKLAGPIGGLPTYCEVPLAKIGGGAFAKVRTGGLTAEAVPSTEELGQFLFEAAALRIPFKATAGLHHPIRAERALTYALDSPRAVLHGFLNVLAAAAMAWHGMDLGHVVQLLEERDVTAIHFSDSDLLWNGHRITVAQVEDARRAFAHSFGACSFEEPVTELRELGLLP
jgi:hypothetical protein